MFRRSLRLMMTWKDLQTANPTLNSGMPAPGTVGANDSQGIPFFGNYFGSATTAEHVSPILNPRNPMNLNKGMRNDPVYRDDDPEIRGKLNKCPYFSLCDMCVWQGMDPQYLDPGILSSEEHLLLLLHGRAHFEKWKGLHKEIRHFAPGMRILKGDHNILHDLCQMLMIPASVEVKLSDRLFDDSALVAMKRDRWKTANLDPTVRSYFTGQVLEECGVKEYQIMRMEECLNKMRTIRVVRRDHIQDENEMADDYRRNMWKDDFSEDDVIVFEYKSVRTLYDLYEKLGVEPYNGQIKLYNYLDQHNTKTTLTLRTEDDYFDFMVHNFYKANLHLFGEPSMSRYTFVVETLENVTREGSWF